MRRFTLLAAALLLVLSASSTHLAPSAAAAAGDDGWVGTLRAHDSYTITSIPDDGSSVSQVQDVVWTISPDPTTSSWSSYFRYDHVYTSVACGPMHDWTEGRDSGLLPALELHVEIAGDSWSVFLSTGQLFTQTVLRHTETCVPNPAGTGYVISVSEVETEVVVYPPGHMGCTSAMNLQLETLIDPIDEDVSLECDTTTTSTHVDRASNYEWNFTQFPTWEADVQYAYVGSSGAYLGGSSVEIRGENSDMVAAVCFSSTWTAEGRGGNSSVPFLWRGVLAAGVDETTPEADSVIDVGRTYDKGRIDEWFTLRYCVAPAPFGDVLRAVYPLDMVVGRLSGTIVEVEHSLSVDFLDGAGGVLRTAQLDESETVKKLLAASWLEEVTVTYP